MDRSQKASVIFIKTSNSMKLGKDENGSKILNRFIESLRCGPDFQYGVYNSFKTLKTRI